MDPVLRDESVYKLAMAVGPDVIAAKVRAFKSEAGAARALGVSEEVVAAGLALQHAAPDAPKKGATTTAFA